MNSFRVRGCNNRRRGAREFWNSGKQKNGSGDRASPMIVQAALRCGSDRRAVNDQAAVFVYLLTLIPRGLGIKVEAKCRNIVAARSSACSPLSCAAACVKFSKIDQGVGYCSSAKIDILLFDRQNHPSVDLSPEGASRGGRVKAGRFAVTASQ